MTAGVVAVSGNPLAGTENIVVNKPAGTVNGHGLIAIIPLGKGSGADLTVVTVPDGWELEDSERAGTNPIVQGWVYSKIANDEPASWTWVLSSAPTGAVGAAIAFENGHASDIVAAITSAATLGGTTVPAPSVETTEDDQLVLGVVFSNWAELTWTKPTGTPTTTEELDSQSGNGANQGTLELFTFIAGAAGATAARSATLSGDNDAGIGFQIALKNAAAGGGAGTANAGAETSPALPGRPWTALQPRIMTGHSA